MGLSLKPLSDRVVVEAAAAEEKSSGGIILPDTAQEKPQQGTVVAIGPGKVSDSGTLVEMTVKNGDKILKDHSGSSAPASKSAYLNVFPLFIF